MRNPDLLLNIAQGDAYCISCEFADNPEFEDIYNLKGYKPHPKYKQTPGTYTDDGQMSLALSEALLNHNEEVLTYYDWAEAFFNTFKRDPRKAYSPGFQKILEETTSIEDFINTVIPTSDKNGAAMRSVPLGVLPSIYLVTKNAEIQAAVTHNTIGGIHSSVIVALLSHWALYEVNLDFDSYLSKTVYWREEFSKPWEGRVAGDNLGMKTAHAVKTLAQTQNTLSGVIKQTLEWGGDTDSVAAIAVGIGGCYMKNDLPEFFETDLENGRYGADYLKLIGKQLMDKFYGNRTILL